MKRRHFVFNLLALTIGAFLKACTTLKTAEIETGVIFKLSEFPDLMNVGGIAVVKIRNDEFVVIRTSAETLAVLSNKCTHRGCILNFNSSSGFECRCHGSGFDLHGNVTRGPAVRPLERLASRLDKENGIFVLF
jgi:Rieske Fe-S protein